MDVSTSAEIESGKITVDVILPAAGSSERMKLPVSKQFLQVQGKHIVAYTVDLFHRLSWIRHIVVTVDSAHIEFTQKLMSNYGFNRVIVCAGGSTRHRSISSGVNALRKLPDYTESGLVIIHDSARPLVPADIILKVAEAAQLHGAAGVTRPLVSTVIKGDASHMLTESLDRRHYRNSEMPQAFKYNVIASAYEKCTQDDFDFGTECLLLALKYSKCPAFLVEGTEDLWKVTYQKDLFLLDSVLKAKNSIVSVWSFLKDNPVSLEEIWSELNSKLIQKTEGDGAANTFVILFDPLETLHLDDLTFRISNQLRSLPHSSVNLRPLLLLIFVSNEIVQERPGLKSDSSCLQDGEIFQSSQLTRKHLVSSDVTISSQCSNLGVQFTAEKLDRSHCPDLTLDSHVQFMQLCLNVLQQVKVKLKTKESVDFITTGVISKITSLAVNELVELISLRSSCLDNQVLSYL
ncbi:isoprenoid synthase domain-containing protein-like isoform X2 [Biomphalaria pfeifferi]|uniref:Isoprenoid synthase domain-containing protein-like isoform X2 n=1 Tax=Biomphalaria pfeifferi TaxID=112525 RepID=A0AAD8F4J3_BIOPF|nr:isoprenoid synthase domain-containing protein-like isoform X2 [Biomphalaria pfeifferi]